MDELKEIIDSKGIKLGFIAKELGITYQGLLNKLQCKTKFNAVEISILKDILNLSLEEIDRIFL